MARSSYIYAVEVDLAHQTSYIRAAFTVKHELFTWLARAFRSGMLKPDHVTIWRLPDGGADCAALIPEEEWPEGVITI